MTTAARLLQIHPVSGVKNVARALEFYEQLGFSCFFRDHAADPRYAAIRRDQVELHLQWQDADQWISRLDRPTIRFLVEEVDRLYEEFIATGCRLDIQPVRNTPWGTREFHLRDLDGNGLQFYQPQSSRIDGT